MLITFLWWLSEGKHELHIPVSDNKFLHLELPPVGFKAPVTVPHGEEETEDVDDPEIDESEFVDDLDAFDEVTE